MPQKIFNIHQASNILKPKLLYLIPDKSLDSIFYVNYGSETNDNTIIIERSYTKQNIITRNKGFHGRTYCTLSVTSYHVSYTKNNHPHLQAVYYSNIVI